MQEDIPSICAQKLKFKQVDIGLVPVALLPELGQYNIISDYCIGANGKVDSVKLYSCVPLSDIKTITLDYQSKSSVTLIKILSRYYWNKNFEFINALPGYENTIESQNAAVVIGDRTFSLNGTFKYEYDLSEEWKKFTGLPFVFAAWVSCSLIHEAFISEFNLALKYGIEHIDEALLLQQNHSNKTSGLITSQFNQRDYLTKKINYLLDEEKQTALNLFLEYIKKL